MPACRLVLSWMNKVTIIPAMMAKTGPPIKGKLLPRNQQGVEMMRQSSMPFQFFSINCIVGNLFSSNKIIL